MERYTTIHGRIVCESGQETWEGVIEVDGTDDNGKISF